MILKDRKKGNFLDGINKINRIGKADGFDRRNMRRLKKIFPIPCLLIL